MNQQTQTEYTPTQKEKALLEVLLNPEFRMKSITDICKAAKCSRNVYYDAFEKPEFRELVKKKSKELVEHALPAMINTFVKQGLRGSYPHGKVILEMGGIYTERQEIENHNTNIIKIDIVDDEE